MATFTAFFASRTQWLYAKQNNAIFVSTFCRSKRNSNRKNKMNYIDSHQIAPTYQSNSRAEDGQLDRSHWSGLCEGVLIPLGSLFAVFLLMLGVMLITH